MGSLSGTRSYGVALTLNRGVHKSLRYCVYSSALFDPLTLLNVILSSYQSRLQAFRHYQ